MSIIRLCPQFIVINRRFMNCYKKRYKWMKDIVVFQVQNILKTYKIFLQVLTKK